VFADGVAGTLSRGNVNGDEIGGGGMGSPGARECKIALSLEQMWWWMPLVVLMGNVGY